MVPNREDKDFTLEDILEEQRMQREESVPPFSGPLEEEAAQEGPEAQVKADSKKPKKSKESKEGEKGERKPASEDTADLNAFATGSFTPPEVEYEQQSFEPMPPKEEKPKKKKKKKSGLFGRKKVPEFDETEDMYYGIQLKPLDEYRKGFDPATGEFTLGGDTFKDLFDDSKKAIDDEVEANFQRLQKERRRRVAQAVQTAGVDEEQVADEFGVAAPMPVTAFAADPYARQHGIEVEGTGAGQEELPEIQRAMLETSADNTMEIKLNVENDTVEIQRVKDMPAVSEESVTKILSAAQDHLAEAGDYLEPLPEETSPQYAEEPVPEEQTSSASEELEEITPQEEEVPIREEGESGEAPAPEEEPVQQEKPQAPPAPKARTLKEIPQVTSVYEYRFRGIPTHIISADVLQSALLSESEDLMKAQEAQESRRAPHRRVRPRRTEQLRAEDEAAAEETQEDIDDYTGPEDAKSISHELKGDMGELSMRMMITGICTVLLAIINLIFGARFSAGGDVGAAPLIYIILTVVLLTVSAGVCYRTIGNGLKALLALNANSDSAAAVAAAAVAVQTISAMFFRSELAQGKLHLYAVLLCAILFVNAAGKLAMIRRIHSNFRFVSSQEQKYSVRIYDDYNTSLKMAKDSVVERPLIAYQCKAGFLKRFLELSYTPDPSEAASQLLAPIGLISSLVLCIASLLITRSVSTALSAFAAASCACVAASNMLSVNLPISRLCKTARRAGAMVVGYEAVEQLGSVNAVIVDAEEVFSRGTVVLDGIKTFGDRAGAVEAIMAASALMKEVGGPLSGVFDQVISENEDTLPQVEKFSYEDEGGIIGRVDGKTIYIGNRSLLINHRIEVPAREEEAQYASANQSIIYLAVDAAVSAMMVLTYSADRRMKNELQRLEDSGVSVLIRTTDPNVTVSLVSRLFGIDANSVSILEGKLGETAQSLVSENIPRADALAATKGRAESLMSVVSACVNEKRTLNLVVAIQNAAVILGFVVVAFMACFGGMGQLSSFILFAFEAFWMLVILILPKLRK